MSGGRKLKKPAGMCWKYWLRLHSVPIAARLGRWFGMSWAKLGDRCGREVLIAQARSNRRVQVVNAADHPLDVVFLMMMGGNHRLASIELVLARALLARGHRVRFVLCDQMLPCCEVKWEGQEHRWQEACAKCYGFGKTLLCGAGFEVIPVSELIADQADSGDWTECVESALLKHFHVGVLPDSAEVADRRGMFTEAARISARAGAAVARMKPDRVVMSHGIYCTWGPAREKLLDAGVQVVTYGEGKKKDTLKFNWNTSADWWDIAAEWERVRDVPLTPGQEATIDAYLQSRRSHSQDARVYNFGEEESIDETYRRLQLDPDHQTFVLFTNVLWDAASAQREIAFTNPVEWVMDTISWFVEHPEKQLVVKIHPAEVVIGTSQPFATLIAERFPSLPPNVRVVRPEEEVNSWSIMQAANLGLAHTSTVGMELPLEGIPVAIVSRTHFRDRGFTIDVNSRQEYFDLLQNWDDSRVDREKLMVLSKRYAYILFERYQLAFPFAREVAPGDVRSLEPVEEEQLLSHSTIQTYMHAIETLGDFLLPVQVD